MNYQVTLRVPTEKGQWIPVGGKHVVPWDNRDLILASCGWAVLNQDAIESASTFLPILQKGILELTLRRDRYTIFEARHGLGTLKETLEFYQELFGDCKGHPFSQLYGAITG